MALPPVCLLAGGLGTRLGERVRSVPKPLIEVAGEPFLLHQLRLLAGSGVTDVVLCVGYLGELIEREIGPERFGIRVAYSYDGPQPAGTLGAVRGARELLGERFLILYGDTYLRIAYDHVVERWAESGLPAMMSVLRNAGRWDTSNAEYADGRVDAYDKAAPTPAMAWIDYGLGGLTSDVLDLAGAEEREVATLYAELARRGELFGYAATERFYEIGTPAALAEADAFLRDRGGPAGP